MQRQSQPRTPLFFPLTLVLVGIVLLLNNYLLINADLVSLWPLVLILIGLQVAWRGDLAPSWQAQSFGITRGTVESASLEVSSAEIDVRLKSLNRAGRLIAGEYTARSRPKLAVRNNHASILMRRGQTWLFSLADWDVQVAQDVPWAILMSSHLGELSADLRGLTLRRAYLTSGIGDVRVTAPDAATGPLYIRSTFGDLYLNLPAQTPALLRIQRSPFSHLILAENSFQKDDSGQFYASPAYQPDQPFVEITLAATFGNITLTVE
jgi:hypothetical protein